MHSSRLSSGTPELGSSCERKIPCLTGEQYKDKRSALGDSEDATTETRERAEAPARQGGNTNKQSKEEGWSHTMMRGHQQQINPYLYEPIVGLGISCERKIPCACLTGEYKCEKPWDGRGRDSRDEEARGGTSAPGWEQQ